MKNFGLAFITAKIGDISCALFSSLAKRLARDEEIMEPPRKEK